ncbi:MAG TPA: hypothetical protein VFL29_07905 [Candidatus Dormibacteraeota bacterium]|nr:hypothetical protein [Candidatus Dormibacteraeota bacterium]
MRRNNNQLREISIKVPAPFAGVSDLGFTAQYRPQDFQQPMRDVPLVIEGPRPPMRRLAELLQLLREADGSAYTWTDPIMVSDEVVLLAFRDRSLNHAAASMTGYVMNLVRPAVFPFLHDCVAVAQLQLSEKIEMRVTSDDEPVTTLALPLNEIVRHNGHRLLWQLDS